MEYSYQYMTFLSSVFLEFASPPLSLGVKGIKLLIRLCEVTTIPLIPVLQFLLLTYLPCTPPFILSMSSNCKAIGSVTRVGVHLFETWMGWHIMYSASMWIFYVLFVGIVCILGYFKILDRQIAAITNTVEKDKCIHIYRSVQILETIFNTFLRIRVVPSVILGTIGLQIMSLYACINLHEELSKSGLVIIVIMGMDAIICNLVVFTLASQVHNSSLKIMRNLGRKSMALFGQGRSIAKRQLRACAILRVKFGSNFIDRGTPLVVETFCINQTMSLTLIKSGRSMN
ncbi:uncharacterized protein LOC110857874 [Folsomia candida]|uniref:uncharacterized protein LOC110857874 n=1 Tax=Folsomia candida TaxID=158441 RepID=UPI0016054826|nr:uncharacterized protein LOC110857874 [Folsomia candida]